MLWTVFVVLLILWALGMVSSYTLGGFIHILLVIAVVVVLIRDHPGPTTRVAGAIPRHGSDMHAGGGRPRSYAR